MLAEDISPTFVTSNIYIRIYIPKALTLTGLRSYEMFEILLIVVMAQAGREILGNMGWKVRVVPK
jgi:hypothetical protein